MSLDNSGEEAKKKHQMIWDEHRPTLAELRFPLFAAATVSPLILLFPIRVNPIAVGRLLSVSRSREILFFF